jgi:cytochrome c oxidase cbb3-type subunit III
MHLLARPSPGLLAILVVGFSSFLNAQAPPGAPNSPARVTPGNPPPPQHKFQGAGGDYKNYPPEVLASGLKVYTANCAFCHGGSAKGGETGPSLVRSELVLHDEDGKLLGAFIRVGRPDKGMPKFEFSPDQVKEIAAFLHDRVRAAAERGTYKILNIVVGDAKAGQTYFDGAGKCTTCHSVQKDLAHVGAHYDPVALQQKVIMPREARSMTLDPATAVTAKVTSASGKVIQGKVKHIDDFSLTLVGADNKPLTIERQSDEIPKVELHDPMEGHLALLKQYTDADIHNLTAYLLTLK